MGVMLLPTQVQHSFSVCASSFQNLCKKNHVMLRATCPANVKVAVCDLVKKCVFKPQPGSLPGEICCGTIVNRSWSQSLLIVSRGCCNWEISQAGFITSIKSSIGLNWSLLKATLKKEMHSCCVLQWWATTFTSQGLMLTLRIFVDAVLKWNVPSV